jgi:hypothetical protein
MYINSKVIFLSKTLVKAACINRKAKKKNYNSKTNLNKINFEFLSLVFTKSAAPKIFNNYFRYK